MKLILSILSLVFVPTVVFAQASAPKARVLEYLQNCGQVERLVTQPGANLTGTEQVRLIQCVTLMEGALAGVLAESAASGSSLSCDSSKSVAQWIGEWLKYSRGAPDSWNQPASLSMGVFVASGCRSK